MKTFVVVLIPCLILCLGQASPARSQTLHYLGDLETDPASLSAEPSSSCYLGNLRTPGALEHLGLDVLFMYGALDSAACGCVGGWQVGEIHLLMASVAAEATTVQLTLAVDGQGWCTYPSGCLEPHAGYWGELFSGYGELEFPEPGYYELVYPATSACAYFGYPYFLKCFGPYESDVRLVVDADGYRECEVMQGVHIGERWWWTPPGWPATSGAPIWWIEASCCESPVRTESRSWSAVKSLYR